MANEFLGIGTQLKIGDGGSPETFTLIPNCLDINGPSESVDLVETTSMDSANQTRTYIPGLKNTGEISFDLNWVPENAVHQQLKSDFDARVTRNFQMILPNPGASVFAFAGIITSFGVTDPVAGVVTRSVTITITGAPTFTV